MKQYVCIDIGGTSIKYGLADEQGTFTVKSSMDTEAREKGAEGIQEKILSILPPEEGTADNTDVNIIMLQLESFVDPAEFKKLTYSHSPAPFFQQLKQPDHLFPSV